MLKPLSQPRYVPSLLSLELALICLQVNPLLNVVGVVDAEVLRARGVDVDAIAGAAVRSQPCSSGLG